MHEKLTRLHLSLEGRLAYDSPIFPSCVELLGAFDLIQDGVDEDVFVDEIEVRKPHTPNSAVVLKIWSWVGISSRYGCVHVHAMGFPPTASTIHGEVDQRIEPLYATLDRKTSFLLAAAM